MCTQCVYTYINDEYVFALSFAIGSKLDTQNGPTRNSKLISAEDYIQSSSAALE